MSFSALDYGIFVAYLLATVGFGAFFVRSQRTVGDFFLAGRGMNPIVVAISVVAALFSGISYLGSAAEVYVHDLSFALIALSFFVATPITALVFLPFFYRSRVFTAYQYLGERFSLPVRMLGSGLFVLRVVLWLALATYAPALALQQVTGLPLVLMVVLTGTLTTVYTALGGMKAVIWTDVVQFFVLVGGQFAIVGVALSHIPGGLHGVYDIGSANGKFAVNLSLDPRARVTLWGLMVGGTFSNLVQLAADQISVQRYLTTKSIEAARRSLWLKLGLTLPVILLFYFTGVILYAFYKVHGGGGDPLTAGKIARSDQILPYFVINELPSGLPAILVAAIFSASMSTVSAGLHALTTTTMVDLIGPVQPAAETSGGSAAHASSEKKNLRLAKWLTVAYGVLITLFSFVVSRFGTLVEATNLIMGLAGGPLLGLFLLGMFTRRGNTRGAIVGWAVGASILALVVLFTKTSFLWYALIGCMCTFISGWAASSVSKPPPPTPP